MQAWETDATFPVVGELAGFRKAGSNGRYESRPGLPLQGLARLWHQSGLFFGYWQSSMQLGQTRLPEWSQLLCTSRTSISCPGKKHVNV